MSESKENARLILRARTHAELLRKGDATVKEIIKASGMTTSEVRQAIRELQTMGIAEKNAKRELTPPTHLLNRRGCYRAVS